MTITDPIVPKFYERKNHWILVQGRESFYDKERNLITFPTEEKALEYLNKKILGKNKKIILKIF